jgi:serine/threonine protein kinase
MGAVLRAVDCDIRREVAVKYMLGEADPKKKLRFIEEAQITGQLEHPNIVPIHELGVDAQKRVFFSMKMVKGRSLQQVLDELRKNPKQAEREWSLGRLLNILVNVCNGLAYAHSRGVVHRDLKPANIMVGDFGEVYLMDWGLAKVLKRMEGSKEQWSEASEFARFMGEPTVPPTGSGSGQSSKVQTSREGDADLTQEGAVLGTPVYMPPEQANGKIDAVDQRSDVYSLGAILYEMLTLEAPVEKDGGYLAILIRVSEGEIVVPEKRNLKRAIPPELSAIAMKSLAREPGNRYQNVAELRKDIERYQEGRSVSAKEDTKTEMLVKFVKRNKGFSAGVAMTFLVLIASLGFVTNALWETSKARGETARVFADYQKEAGDKEKRTTQAVPAFVQSARLMANDGQIDKALKQIDVALEYDSTNIDARLLKGQIFISQRDWKAGRAELEAYVKQKKDADAIRLLEFCVVGKERDSIVLTALAEILQKQKVFGLATGLLQDVGKTVKARQPLLGMYQKQINTAWPGLGERLNLQPDGQFRLYLGGLSQVSSLEPLKGMPLGILAVNDTRIRDLAPLKGMPLTSLGLQHCAQVSDLMPLQRLPLTTLDLGACGQVSDLTPLKGMPLTYLSLGGTGVKDLTPLRGMSLSTLYLDGCRQLPGDLSPLQGMPLTTLSLLGCILVKDLSPLKGMPLTTLSLRECSVQDLTPLKGMPLTFLHLGACWKMQDLTPLKGMRLKTLFLFNTAISDLTPLDGMELEDIRLTPKAITKGMEILRPMKNLKTIGIGERPDEALSAAEFWKRYDAGEFKK